MKLLNKFPESFASETELRLEAAMKVATLKAEIEKYRALAELNSESSISRTEMRLTAAIKIAALKMEIEKYQEIEKPATQANEISAAEPPPISTPTQLIDKNEPPPRVVKNGAQENRKTKISESDWVNEQARKLLGGRGAKKRFTIK